MCLGFFPVHFFIWAFLIHVLKGFSCHPDFLCVFFFLKKFVGFVVIRKKILGMEMGQEAVAAAAAPLRLGAPPPTSLAPGFRFHPTDEELVRYYLRRKVCKKPFKFNAVTEIDVYKSEPWELAGISRHNLFLIYIHIYA